MMSRTKGVASGVVSERRPLKDVDPPGVWDSVPSPDEPQTPPAVVALEALTGILKQVVSVHSVMFFRVGYGEGIVANR